MRICGGQSQHWVGKLVAATPVSGGESGARAQAAVMAQTIQQGLLTQGKGPLESWPDLSADYSVDSDNLLAYQFVPQEAVHAGTPQYVRLVFVILIDPALAWDFGGVIFSTVAEGIIDGPAFVRATELIEVRAD